MNQQDALAHGRGLLESHGAEHIKDQSQPFRRRSDHIRRVCMWLDRLLVQGGVEDMDALRLAAALHDVGYIHSVEAHGKHSAAIIREYAAGAGIDPQVAERAAFLASEHSNKDEWMTMPDAPRDLILLMEADLLDEEGAMGLVFDCMSAAVRGAASFEDTYARMLKYEPPRLAKNPMITPLARSFWAQKQRIIREFMQAFAFDLGIDPDQ